MNPIEGCHEHCCSGFYRLERLPQNLAGPNLSNPIHPIFARHRFDSQINHLALEPSLRLATHLIEASLPFFSHIIHAHKVLLSVGPRGKASYELQNGFAYPGDEEINFTRTTLMDFAAFMMFDLTPVTTPEETYLLPSETGFGPFMPNGKARFINVTLARKYYQQAIDIHNCMVVDVVGVHYNLFNIAVTLVHEVVHAFMMTVMHKEEYSTVVLPDVYFPGSLCAEEGFEWEKYTFGGLVSARGPGSLGELADHYVGGEGKHFYSYKSNNPEVEAASDVTRMISMAEWPNLTLLESYQSTGDLMGCRGILPEVHIRWNVDFGDIHKLFQDSFWTQPIWPGSLRFAKRTGQRFFGSQQEGEEGEEVPFGTVDDGDVDVTNGVHSGCRVHYHPSNSGTGLVLAPGCGHPFEDAGMFGDSM